MNVTWGGDGTGAPGGDWTKRQHFLPWSDRRVVNLAQTQGLRFQGPRPFPELVSLPWQEQARGRGPAVASRGGVPATHLGLSAWPEAERLARLGFLSI